MIFCGQPSFLWAVFEAQIHGGGPQAHSGATPYGRSVFVFSFWTDIFIVTSLTHFWFCGNDLFSLHQAKES